jgi:hypothetical protein
MRPREFVLESREEEVNGDRSDDRQFVRERDHHAHLRRADQQCGSGAMLLMRSSWPDPTDR